VAKNDATAVETRRSSSKAGLYVLSPLTAGTYSVTVTFQGFKSVVRNGIVVDANGSAEVNVTLSAGLTEEVTVAEVIAPLNTTDARLVSAVVGEVYPCMP